MKLNVDFTANASGTATVELSDDELKVIADNLGVKVSELTVDDVCEAAVDKGNEAINGICAHCSGWGNERWSMDISDWEVDDDSQREPQYRGVRIIEEQE